ncbi:MAG: efflux RND transporter periplasmic adaptor subunit [Actinomycetota bacterium]|nr:efflux RND transporter periplasmic adaptor subunit [Actinomycetota bacterium]
MSENGMDQQKRRSSIKPMIMMLIIVGIIFGFIFGYHAYKSYRNKKMMAARRPPPVTVTAIKVQYSMWQPQIKAVGGLRAVRGVDVTSEIAGLVRRIYFRSGETAFKGQALVQLNADSDIALLHSLEAAAQLARTVFERDKKQFAIQAVSRATLDADAADLKSKLAQAAQQKAIVAQKTIRAPFAGQLGISTINPGQYINPGNAVVTLQMLNPLYADFNLPQQQFSAIRKGQSVVAESDAYPRLKFTGTITSINPKVDPASRNVLVEATLRNPGHKLLPGMYVTVDINTGLPKRYITIPQTAVTYNPYGDTVFVITKSGKAPGGKPLLTVNQAFVATGPTRGDQVAILSGLTGGETVVTSGQMKLKNGMQVVINNSIQPGNNPAPTPPEE